MPTADTERECERLRRELAAKDEEIARLLQKVAHLDAALYLERTSQRIKHAKQEAAQ